MSISSIGHTQHTRSASSLDELRGAQDDASGSSFAAILAGCAQEAPRAEVKAPKRAERLSENETEDTDDTSETQRTKRAKPASVSDRAAELGTAAAGLAPGLKDKLARVVTRMRDEFGKTVTVNEGVRSQARQNALFAQGRTAPGPIVTWTKASLHGKGLAADLMVDGGFTDAQGFAELQQVAREEGLHTLGKIDPGHVELRDASPVGEFIEGIGTSVGSALKTPAARASQVAQVAQVANVAQVAAPAPARVATVAQVAQVSLASAGAAQVRGGDGQARGKDAGARDGGTRGEHRGDTRAPLAPATDATSGNLRAYAEMSRPDASQLGSDGAVSSTASVAASTASRVDQVMDLQESRAPRVLSHLNLSLDDGQGGRDVVRIGMRGNEVGADFQMRDAANATRVSARLGDLTSALERRGLEPQTFSVRHTGHAAELDAASARVGTIATSDTSAARNDDRSDARGFNRQQHNRDDQEARRQAASDRRRSSSTTSFSLNTEEV